LRALAAPATLGRRPPVESDRPLITFARGRSTRRRLRRQVLFIWEVDVEDRARRPVATCVVATASILTGSPSTRSELKAVVALTAAELVRHVESAAHGWRLQVIEGYRRFVDARIARERAIRASVDSRPRAGIQPGLFDGRAAHAQAADQAALEEMSDAVAQRIALLESVACVETTSPPRLRLVLLP
jgi:hypothetical protein